MGVRTNKVLTELNISLNALVEYLNSAPGLEPQKVLNVNTKLTDKQYQAALNHFKEDKDLKEKIEIKFPSQKQKKRDGIKIVGKIDLDSIYQATRPKRKNKKERLEDEIAKEQEKKIDDKKRIGGVMIGVNNYVENLIRVPLVKLKYRKDYIAYETSKGVFVYAELGLSPMLNSHKNHPNIRNKSTDIILDHKNHTFRIVNNTVLKRLRDLSTLLENDYIDKHIKDSEKNQKDIKANNLKCQIALSKLRFCDGLASFVYKGKRYKYKNSRIKDFANIIDIYLNRCTLSSKKRFNTEPYRVILDLNKQTFSFVDFDLCDYIMKIKDSYIPVHKNPNQTKKEEVSTPSMQSLPPLKISSAKLYIDNIEFYDGFYMIFLLKDGTKNESITPLKVIDNNSYACLRHVHRYFSERFPQNIIIKYNSNKVIGLSKPYILSKYIRTLYDNIDVHGDWWEEVQNERKPSLTICRNSPTAVVKKKVSLRSGYIDNLASMQNDQKLIPVYEINHGNQEDAFIFSVSMPENRCAIIFENVSADASTATEVFITKMEDYEACVNLVFNYFTDYTISTKRDSLRRGVNPPNKFNAEGFYSVVHGELETWLIKINQILEHTPQKSNIEFVSGLHVPHDIEARSGHNETAPKNVHNELMRKLYSKLCIENGTDNVGTEIRIGSKRIDAVVKSNDNYDIYEIKSDQDPFTCITIALGQICQYAYLYCRDKIGKMVIVGTTAASSEVERYLSWFRKKHSMEVYYMRI